MNTKENPVALAGKATDRQDPTQISGQGRNLPPDPDAKNDSRAGFAQAAVRAFRKETNCDEDEAVADLLDDLMHLCDRRGISFRAELQRAKAQYLAETYSEDRPPLPAAAPRLWIAMVDHKYVPGTRLTVFHQVAEPQDEEILPRFAEDVDVDVEELTISGLFDCTHELMASPESACAMTQFAEIWLESRDGANTTRSRGATVSG